MSTAMNRLLWWHWLLIGFGASLVLLGILYFTMIRPKQLDTVSTKSEADGTEGQGGTPEKVLAKNNELKKKKADTIRINEDWKKQSAVYMPPIDFNKDPILTYEPIGKTGGVYTMNGKSYGVRDLPAIWGQWVTMWYASQWREGITPLNGFPVNSFSADPNDVSSLKAIAFPQAKPWDVEVVAKDFDSAMNHLKRFNGIQHHGMPVVDKVTIAGQSPDLHVKYTLQLFIIPPTVPPAMDPKITGSGGGGGSAPGGSSGPSSMSPAGSASMMGGGKAASTSL